MAVIRSDDKTPKTDITVYLKADREAFGDVIEFGDNYTRISLTLTSAMVIDEFGTVHPGYLTSAAIYAAACAVNDPLAIPVESTSKFITPVEKGKKIDLKADCSHASTRTRDVHIVGKMGEILVFECDVKMVITDKHPMSIKLAN